MYEIVQVKKKKQQKKHSITGFHESLQTIAKNNESVMFWESSQK